MEILKKSIQEKFQKMNFTLKPKVKKNLLITSKYIYYSINTWIFQSITFYLYRN